MNELLMLVIGVFLGWYISFNFYNKSKTTMEKFKNYLKEDKSWTKSCCENLVMYLFNKDCLFQIEVADDGDDFKEPWIEKYYFPNKDDAKKYKVYLKVGGVCIADMYFILLDGGNYFVPLPDTFTNDITKEVTYKWESGSTKLLVAKIIGRYYRNKTIEEFAEGKDMLTWPEAEEKSLLLKIKEFRF